MTVILFNIIIKNLIKFLSRYEKEETLTAFNLNISLKIVIATFINTALIPLLIYQSTDWFTNYGLINDVILYVLSINFVKPTLDLISPSYIKRLIERKRELKKGVRSTLN